MRVPTNRRHETDRPLRPVPGRGARTQVPRCRQIDRFALEAPVATDTDDHQVGLRPASRRETERELPAIGRPLGVRFRARVLGEPPRRSAGHGHRVQIPGVVLVELVVLLCVTGKEEVTPVR